MKAFLISYAIVLIPFLIVNGFLTAIPVVLYNDAENLGIRIYTIPFEDAFYGMLLVMMNISIFEKLRSKLNFTSLQRVHPTAWCAVCFGTPGASSSFFWFLLRQILLHRPAY